MNRNYIVCIDISDGQLAGNTTAFRVQWQTNTLYYNVTTGKHYILPPVRSLSRFCVAINLIYTISFHLQNRKPIPWQ